MNIRLAELVLRLSEDMQAIGMALGALLARSGLEGLSNEVDLALGRLRDRIAEERVKHEQD